MEAKLLHSKIVGQGKPMVILHGFLGMSDNWKTLANRFSEDFEVHVVDQRNHGRSFHSDHFSYSLLVEDLKLYLDHYQIESCVLIGHSMGGKTAMQFAIEYPKYVDRLVVADIAPKTYPAHHQYILKALSEVDFSLHTSRKAIEQVLSGYIKEMGVIQFLMKNVYRKEKDQLDYRFNLPVLIERYNEVVTTFESDELYEGQALFLKGGKSNYITREDNALILKHFPKAIIESIPNAGHWLHAEQPVEFYEKVMRFC